MLHRQYLNTELLNTWIIGCCHMLCFGCMPSCCKVLVSRDSQVVDAAVHTTQSQAACSKWGVSIPCLCFNNGLSAASFQLQSCSCGHSCDAQMQKFTAVVMRLQHMMALCRTILPSNTCQVSIGYKAAQPFLSSYSHAKHQLIML